MQRNVGSKEKYVRLTYGALASGLAFSPWVHGWQRIALGVIGASGLLTGATRYCPINAAFGVNRYTYDLGGERIGREAAEDFKSTPLGLTTSSAGAAAGTSGSGDSAAGGTRESTTITSSRL